MMERVFIIKESKAGSAYNLLKILNDLVDDDSSIDCSLSIKNTEYDLVYDFCKTNNFEIKINSPKKNTIFKSNMEIIIIINKQKLEKLVYFLKKQNYNAIVKNKEIVFDINDNDGDLLIINTNNENYEKISKIAKTYNL